jgi:hypothetical protein
MEIGFKTRFFAKKGATVLVGGNPNFSRKLRESPNKLRKASLLPLRFTVRP